MLRHIGRLANQGVPAYTELDMRIAWRARQSLELALNGHNLLHAAHGEFGPAGRELIERSVYVLLTWQR